MLAVLAGRPVRVEVARCTPQQVDAVWRPVAQVGEDQTELLVLLQVRHVLVLLLRLALLEQLVNADVC